MEHLIDEIKNLNAARAEIDKELFLKVTEFFKGLPFKDGEFRIGEEYRTCVTYDGGNHPEYASNAFSTVYAVRRNEHFGNIGLEIDETDFYDIDRVVDVSELSYLAENIGEYINYLHTIEEK